MSNRFVEWIALLERGNSLRWQMLVLSALAVGLYLSINVWPAQLRPVGRRAIIVLGGLTYAVLFIFALWTLGLSLAMGR